MGKRLFVLITLSAVLVFSCATLWAGDEGVGGVMFGVAQKAHYGAKPTESMPTWLINALVVAGISLLVAIAFILLLKSQVKAATGKILQREASLRESEEIFNQFMKHSPIYIFFKDEEIRSLKLSSNYETMLGKPLEELIGKNMFDLFPSDFARKIIADDQAILKEDKIVEIEEEFNGHYYSTIKFPLQLPGKPKYLAGFTIDVTERKAADDRIKSLLAEKSLLLNEVHHRIKNNMNTIKGLLDLQIDAEENPSAAESLRDAESRVQSILMLYDRLYFTDNYRELSIKEYLQPLAEEIVGSFAMEGKVRVEMHIEDFIVNVKQLSPLGIIVNELLTNMMKYAFANRDHGLITVSASLQDGRIRVGIQDDGIGLPESVSFEKSTGFGMRLVKMLMDQLGGSISIERGYGTKFLLEFDM